MQKTFLNVYNHFGPQDYYSLFKLLFWSHYEAITEELCAGFCILFDQILEAQLLTWIKQNLFSRIDEDDLPWKMYRMLPFFFEIGT